MRRRRFEVPADRAVKDARTREEVDRDARFLAAEISTTIPTLDLHKMTRAEARHAVEEAIERAFAAGDEAVRIIHGAGTGALREEVRCFLSEHPLVDAWRPAPIYSASGAVHVLLGKNHL